MRDFLETEGSEKDDELPEDDYEDTQIYSVADDLTQHWTTYQMHTDKDIRMVLDTGC